jgi:hypothetical protein
MIVDCLRVEKIRRIVINKNIKIMMSIARDFLPGTRRKYNHNANDGNKLNSSLVPHNEFMI